MVELKATAHELAAPRRGLLDIAGPENEVGAAGTDASAEGGEATKDFFAWCELICGTEGLGDCFVGVVLPAAVLDGRPKLVDALRAQGLVVGVRVDTGFYPLNGYGERGTSGLVALEERCERYYREGARFAHWRSTFECSMELPTDVAVWESTNALAECARTCQCHGLVPVLEVEVTSGDGAHSIERAAYVGEKIYSQATQQLHEQDVNVEAVVLLPSVCSPGSEAPPAQPHDVAEYTSRMLWRTVPPAVPSVRLLTGSLAPAEAGGVLSAVHASIPGGSAPWTLDLAYGGSLLDRVRKTWDGRAENVAAAQGLLLDSARESVSRAKERPYA